MARAAVITQPVASADMSNMPGMLDTNCSDRLNDLLLAPHRSHAAARQTASVLQPAPRNKYGADIDYNSAGDNDADHGASVPAIRGKIVVVYGC
jgi:hypothetical protein